MTAEYPQGDWRWEPVTDELLDGLPPAPFRLTLQQAALVSAPAADIYVCENPAAPALS